MPTIKKISFEELLKGKAFSAAFSSLNEQEQKIVKLDIEKIINEFNNKILYPISEIKKKA
jgi:hypothetical protein